MRQPLSVLVIEDSADDFYFLNRVIQSSEDIEARVFHQERLADAIAFAQSCDIDVAIIDLSLPDSFGLDTFLGFHEAMPATPTIIMTGHKDYNLAFEAVQKGAQDYLFKGEPSATAIIRTIRYAIERQRLMTELQTALDHVKQLQGLLPICSACKKIRDDKGYWNRIESSITRHSEAKFTHGLCPDCARKLFPQFCGDDAGKGPGRT
jgi:DNA-binding NtrC family response regulator